MKRIGLLFVSLLLIIGNVSAQDIMVVTKKDGTKTTFSVGSVHEVTFISSEDIDVSVNEIIPTSTTSFIVNYSVSTAGKINESGIYYGLDETASARKVIGELVNGKGSVEVSGLNFSTTYYIKAYANIDGDIYNSDVTSHTTSTRFPEAKMVDLGLSVKWASHDLGAICEKNIGQHLPWGDVSGNAYNNETYPNINITDYDISGTKYDIATHQWGEEWRMPSLEEFQELWDNTTKTLLRNHGYNNLSAVKFTANNGNYIILYLGGYTENASLKSFDMYGFYWTSILPTENNGWPVAWGIQSATNGYKSTANKPFGLLIRPVSGKRADQGNDEVEHDYVDLGLSRLWATTNFGAEKDTDAGTYIAWGEDKEKEEYILSNYALYKDSAYVQIEKNLTEEGKDIVANTWGGKWHTPTYAELEELRTECNWTWTSKKNAQNIEIYGYKVTSKTNGNSIFLPVTGEKFEKSVFFEDYGRYWTSQPYVGTEEWAYILSFSENTYNLGGKTKYRGCVIRPVRKR